MRIPLLLIPALLAGSSGCSEEDRRAWVSILPESLSDEETPAPVEGSRAGEIALAADSAAALLGSDTLFTLDQVRMRAPDGSAVAAGRLAALLLSPDSTLVAFATVGDTAAVGIWSRPRQIADLAEVLPGGSVDTLAWSSDGRFLAFGARTAEGRARAGVYDARLGWSPGHPILDWLDRAGRSARLEGWSEGGRLRILVSAGAEPVGGLAYVWDPARGAFAVEAHLEPLAAEAPPGAALEPGGVFSVDLLGNEAPETVALYRSDGAPGAIVLESRGDAFRGRVTFPLTTPAVVGLERWADGARGLGLYLVAPLGGRATLLLELPSPDPALRAIGLFQATPAGGLDVLSVVTPGGEEPAIFLDGRTPGGSAELGLVDLDNDGALEVVSATGRLESGPPNPTVSWTALVLRVSGRTLVPAPELEGVARARIAEATSAGGRREMPR